MVTCLWQGRCGNIFYQTAMAYAYALKHNMEFQIPTMARHCDGNEIYFHNLPFNKNIILPPLYSEPLENGNPYFHEVPKFENVTFVGYWQSFKYIDDYREQILKAFNIPYKKREGVTSIHVRRGDYLTLSDTFPPLPMEYYKIAIDHMGPGKYMVFSDDISWCKEQFTVENFPGCEFEFSEGNGEIKDLELMSGCENNIIANSSFSFVASWLNQNPNKKVICPSNKNLFKSSNLDMIPDSYIQVQINH